MERGCLHIYYGDGKGKTSAALGLALRAAGAGLKVCLLQFLKRGDSPELAALHQVSGVTVLPGPICPGFVFQMDAGEKAVYAAACAHALEHVLAQVQAMGADVLLLDEVLDLPPLGLVEEPALARFLQGRPQGLEVVATGHHVSQTLLDLGDYVTRMVKEKHPYDQGLSARRGIEF